ncbi:protein Mis18-beta [Tachysurus ichikawai]
MLLYFCPNTVEQQEEASERGRVMRRGPQHQTDKPTTTGTFQGFENGLSKGNGLVSVLEPCDSSSQSSVIWTQLRDMEDTVERGVEYDKCSVFHCANVKCNLVLGDSLGACGELQDLRAIICLKISKDVRIRGKMEMSKEGPLKFW